MTVTDRCALGRDVRQSDRIRQGTGSSSQLKRRQSLPHVRAGAEFAELAFDLTAGPPVASEGLGPEVAKMRGVH